MKQKLPIQLIYLFFATTLAYSGETKIELFGQSCLLQGPFSTDILLEVHSISPGEIPLLTSLNSAKTILERMEKVKKTPKNLDPYKTKSTERAKKGIEFYEALSNFQTQHKKELLLEYSKKYLKKDEQKLLLTYLDAKDKQNSEEIVKIATKDLGDAPEAEFHKSLRSMKTEYLCNFDHEE